MLGTSQCVASSLWYPDLHRSRAYVARDPKPQMRRVLYRCTFWGSSYSVEVDLRAAGSAKYYLK